MAIKLEHHQIEPSFLKEEFERYECLRGKPGIPRIYWYGFADEYRAMVMEVLGPNLKDLLNYCHGNFTLKTTLMIIDRIIPLLQYVHSKAIIHQDIKPRNFLMGVGKYGNRLYMTDFGLATEYFPEDNATAGPISGLTPGHLTGTAQFASLNGHLGRSITSRQSTSEIYRLTPARTNAA